MNQLLALALPLRCTILFAVGTLAGSIVNWATYNLAWNRRSISPWSLAPPQGPPRRFSDRIPVVGWWGLRREVSIHGRGFWIRPMLVELAMGLGWAVLYWWEVVERGLVVPQIVAQWPAIAVDALVIPPVPLHLTFVSHVILAVFLLAGSLIDVDEKTIPDGVTVTGTLCGLMLAATLPWSLLPQVDLLAMTPPLAEMIPMAGAIPAAPGGQLYLKYLTASAPHDMPAVLGGAPQILSLAVGLACYGLWLFALAPRTWYSRHGWRRAFQLFAARFGRAIASWPMMLLGGAGGLGIVVTWSVGGAAWEGLLSALMGLVGGGVTVWSVRLLGAATLRREAMGFGDVTLMMMIGTFLGWQSCVVIFFLAPFAGLLIGIGQLLLNRDQVIPYGPFLCLATLVTIVRWGTIWPHLRPIFGLNGLVPAVLAICFVLMGVMLAVWQVLRNLVGGKN